MSYMRLCADRRTLGSFWGGGGGGGGGLATLYNIIIQTVISHRFGYVVYLPSPLIMSYMRLCVEERLEVSVFFFTQVLYMLPIGS